MTNDKPNPFTLIKYAGEPNKAEFEGIPIVRQEKLFIAEWSAFVVCTPYDNHFIFEVPKARKRAGISDYLCTCGSMAVVANPELPSRMFVCLFEANNGYHQTTILNKKDFENVAGETLTTEGGKKWLI